MQITIESSSHRWHVGERASAVGMMPGNELARDPDIERLLRQSEVKTNSQDQAHGGVMVSRYARHRSIHPRRKVS